MNKDLKSSEYSILFFFIRSEMLKFLKYRLVTVIDVPKRKDNNAKAHLFVHKGSAKFRD